MLVFAGVAVASGAVAQCGEVYRANGDQWVVRSPEPIIRLPYCLRADFEAEVAVRSVRVD